MLRIGCCIRLNESNATYHLKPIAEHPWVRELHCIRHAPLESIDGPKFIHHPVDEYPNPQRFYQMYRVCRRLVCGNNIEALISFNPFPYALIAIFAAAGRSIPVHFGFIGADWYGRFQRLMRPLLIHAVRRADMITVTGSHMKADMIRYHVPAERIHILPHGIDLDRFTINEPAACIYDFIFVGQLIRRKRIDVLIRALVNVHKEYPAASLCIVGDGPLRGELENLTRELGLEASITFTGHARDVAEHLRSARILVLTSDSEGLPFALVEAMATGLVPVCTDVGTISDLIKDGQSGFLINTGDVYTLSKRLKQLRSDPVLFNTLRDKVIKRRQNFGFSGAANVWQNWFESDRFAETWHSSRTARTNRRKAGNG